MPAHFRPLFAPMVSVTTALLPGGATGTPYSQQFTGIGGTPPYTWYIVGGQLPTGLNLSSSGLLSGTPTTAATFAFSVQAQDVNGLCGAQSYLVTVTGLTNVWFGAQLPTLPTQFSTTSAPPLPANTNRGSYYTPGVGGDAGLTLQAALNAAAAATGTKGDVIVLQSGTTYTTASVFTLPARTGSGWIYVIANTAPELGGIGLPAAGTRATPANLAAMASLRTTLANTGGPVVNRANGAGVSQYRLVGLDLELTDATAQSGNVQFYVVNFNNGDTSVATLAQNITLDRCYISGAPTTGVRHAVGLDGVNMEVTECYIEHCYQFGNGDTNAIVAINSTGPYRVHNNYLNSQGEITLFGGSDTTLPSPSMPSDIACTNNYYFKQTFTGTGTVATATPTTLTIATVTSGLLLPGMYVLAASGFIPNFNQIVKQLTGTTGGVGTYQLTSAVTGTSSGNEAMTGNPYGKNSQEFKVGQRVLFDSNYVDHAFATIQPRTAFVLTGRNQSGANPWYGLFNFTISNNVFTDCQQGGINVLLQDNNSTASDRILFRNNLFILSKNDNTSNTCSGFVSSNSSTTGGAGAGSNVIWDHNTFIATAGQSSSMIFCGQGAPTHMSLTNMVWSNNIFDNSNIGLSDAGGGIGYASVVPRQSTPVTWINNVHIGTPDNTLPAGNFHAASQAATGFISYGSNTSATGYALAPSSPYHGAGVSGFAQPANSSGTPDGSDIGCNIAALPSKQFSPPSLLTISQAGYIIVANSATLTAAGITQTHSYNVDPTGVADSTAGIQSAINDGCLNYQPLYLPNQPSGAQGIYKITNTLEFYTFSGFADTAYSLFSGHHFLSATNTQGQNPVLQASNAAGNWTNLLQTSGLARPVVMIRSFTGGTQLPTVTANNNMNQDPYAAFTGSDSSTWGANGNGTANVCPGTWINLNINTGGLANAGGISINGAQTLWVANLQINSTGSVYGIGVLPGNGSVLMNVNITGGQYGINSFMTYALSNWQSDTPTVAGLTCIGQTKACVTAGGTASPILIVGADLEPATGGVAYDPVATSDSFNVNHSAMFYNVKVVGAGDANSTAFKNAGGYNLYLGDVWVSGFTNVTQFAALGAQVCGGTWTHVTEYVATNQYKGNTIHTGTAQPPWPTFNWVNGVVTTGNAGDGTLQNQPATSITTGLAAAPTNLVSRHVVPLPLIDTTPYVDIRTYNAKPFADPNTGSTHNRATFTFNFSNDAPPHPAAPLNQTPIQNAVNAAAAASVPTAVLVPLGVWEVEGQIHVPANVQIMGVGSDYRSWVSTHINWVPTGPAPGTPVFTTDSNANSTMAFANFGINMRRAMGTTYSANGGQGYNNDFFIPYIWQCGGQCFTFGNQHHYQFITTPVTTFALQYRQFQGANAGGRFYGGDTPDSQIGLGCNTAARAMMVNGSQQPMYFYSLNLENSKNNGVSMAYNMELTGAANVRAYGTKREGNGNTYSITQNCNNVGLFGSSFIRIGSPANATFIGATGNQNILVNSHTAFSDTTSTTNYILSDAGSGFNLDSPKILSVYKNGTLNDAAMVIGPAPALSPVFNFTSFNAGNTTTTDPSLSPTTTVYLGPASALSGNAISILPGPAHSGGKVGYGTQISTGSFTCDFNMTPPSGVSVPAFNNPVVIGISFVIQNSNGTTNNPSFTRLNAGGDANMAGSGSQWVATTNQNYPIGNSMAIKFDMQASSTSWNPGISSSRPNQVGLYACGGPSDNYNPAQDLNPLGINFWTGNPIAVHLVYDGTLLVMTMLDTVTNNQARLSWPVNIPVVTNGGPGTAWVCLDGGKANNATASSTWLINSWSFSQGYNTRLATPTFSVPAGQYSSSQSVTISGPAGASIYYATGAHQPTSADTLYTGPVTVSANTFLQAIAVQSGFTDSLVASANYLIQAAGQPTINFPSGFASAGNLLSLNGVAVISGSNLQVTPFITAVANQPSGFVGAAWYMSPVTVSGAWSTTFTFQIPAGNPTNDLGLCFVIQNQPPASDFKYNNAPPSVTDSALRWSAGGTNAFASGAGFAYSGTFTRTGVTEVTGFTRALAIKFDSTNNTTGLFQGVSDTRASGTATGLNFTSGQHQFQVTVTYDGTNLAWTIKDLTTLTTFSSGNQAVNIANLVGGSTAYVGFTAGSFYGNNQQVLSWTGF